MADFRYDYTKYRSRAITVEKLDQLAEFVFADTGTSTISMIFTGIKLALALAYLSARTIMIDKEQAIARQIYEIERDGKLDPDKDDMDVKPKP
jgi:hypothetical protein